MTWLTSCNSPEPFQRTVSPPLHYGFEIEAFASRGWGEGEFKKGQEISKLSQWGPSAEYPRQAPVNYL